MSIRLNNKILGGSASVPNDGKLTITQGSNNLGEFTANSSTDVTVDIPTPTIPTKLSQFTDDLGADPTHTHSQYLRNIVQSRESITSASSITIYLKKNITIYTITPYTSTQIYFNLSNLTLASNETVTFEVKITLTSLYSITFNNVRWLYNETPDLSEVGVYYFVFRTDNSGSTWYGNLQGRWS